MSVLKSQYILPVLSALLLALGLIWYLFPPALYAKAVLVVGATLGLVIFWFSWIDHRRIRDIRNQMYAILKKLGDFDLEEPEQVEFETSSFRLFNELNVNLLELIDRITANYLANKQFTQNASHELQTPLAIIKGHVEMLLQSPNIGEKEVESLAIVLQNTNRLSKLNNALILLSKIENQRFVDYGEVDFIQVTETVLQLFEDQIQIQGLELRKAYEQACRAEISKTLAEILLTNLIQNAIRYNQENGHIQIKTTADRFRISNPGKAPEVEVEQMFGRFRRDSAIEESLGLGLSIVKRICEQSGLVITYIYADGLHTLELKNA